MNTAKNINTNGSESCNTMSKGEKARAAWGELKGKRMGFCGSRAVLVQEDQALGVMVFCAYYGADGVTGERFLAVGFSGKRAKPDFNFLFKSKTAMQEYVKGWLAGVEQVAQQKAAKRAEDAAKRVAGHKLAVGDVLATCWGYEQTNVDYYQVTALVGKCMVEIRQIASMREETGWMQGVCSPAKGQFIGEPMRKRVCADGRSVKIKEWGLWANKMEPKKVAGIDVYPVNRYTAYA